MVCAPGNAKNDAATVGGTMGHFELNVFKPVIAANVLQSCLFNWRRFVSFIEKCSGLVLKQTYLKLKALRNSLMLVTALNPHIGYENALQIAKTNFTKEINKIN